ncbi:nucleotidyltransferase, partial [Mycobacterium tuberculosis]
DRHDLTSDGVCVMPEPVFNRTELQRAFTALAAKLERRGVVGQVHVVGGAAMLLAYNSRVTTRDIDALFSTDGPMLEAIREVADEMGWPRTWLNNQASGYVSRTPGEGAPVFDHPFLHVVATPAQHLLAMKVVAARGVRDGEDIRLLLDRLRITSAAGVWEIVARYFPAETITDRSRLLVEDLLNQ